MRQLVAVIVTAFALLMPSSASAQTAPATKPVLFLFADTAGVSAVAHDVYITWVWAKASDNAQPVAGALVGFDCGKQLVKRFYRERFVPWTSDSLLVRGEIKPDSTAWVPIHYPKMFTLVCSAGRSHGIDPNLPQPTYPDSAKAQPDPKSLYPVS